MLVTAERGMGAWPMGRMGSNFVWHWRDEYGRDRGVWTRSADVVYFAVVVDNIVIHQVLVRRVA